MVFNPVKLWRAGVYGGAACALLTAAWVQGADAPAKPAQAGLVNVKINGPQSPSPDGRLGRPGEAVAADPAGNLLVAGWETIQGTCGPPFGGKCTAPKTPGVTAFGYSIDGGKTWTDGGPLYLGDNVMTSGRPWLDRGGVDNQTFFFASRARTVEETRQDLTPGGSGQIGVVLYRGRFQNGALTWTDQQVFAPKDPDDLFRSQSVVAAKDGSGKVYLTLTNLRGVCGRPGTSSGQIEVFRSADEGKTWEGPVVVGPDDTLSTANPRDIRCGSEGSYQIASSAALGPNGEVYLIWQFGPKVLNPYVPVESTHTVSLRFAKSTDGGRTFTAPRDLVAFSSMRENGPVGYSKDTINDAPRIAMAHAGPHRGRIYVTYAGALTQVASRPINQSVVSSQAYLIYSDDQGESWSEPVALGPRVPPTGLKRFWPAVAVRDGGEVDVIYMESQEKQVTPDPNDIECKTPLVIGRNREGKVSSLVDVYWAQSKDGGESFGPPVRVTSQTSNWCKVEFASEGTQFANFGDHLGIFAAGNRAFAVWPDGRNGMPDAYFAELRTSGAVQTGKRKK